MLSPAPFDCSSLRDVCISFFHPTLDDHAAAQVCDFDGFVDDTHQTLAPQLMDVPVEQNLEFES
jgi:hypothetical protein